MRSASASPHWMLELRRQNARVGRSDVNSRRDTLGGVWYQHWGRGRVSSGGKETSFDDLHSRGRFSSVSLSLNLDLIGVGGFDESGFLFFFLFKMEQRRGASRCVI